jgi:DNA-binding transcriptional MerR regulator
VAQLSISDAARIAGVSRVTLHRYIKAGKLSRTPEGLIDTAELLRIGMVLHPDTVYQPVTVQQDVTPPATPPVSPAETATLQQLISVLQRELDAAHAREQAARDREALLLQMLQQVQQQSQRLLEAGQPPPGPTPPHPMSQRERGDMRQRIVTLLRDYPEGLSPMQTQQLLGVDKALRSTMKAMVRDGLLTRVALGGVPAVLEQKTTIFWNCLYLLASLKASPGLGGVYETNRRGGEENLLIGEISR